MTLAERRETLGGLEAVLVGDRNAATVVVVLHGRQMQGSDLAPFAHSLGVDALFVFPDAPISATPRGRSWWPSAAERAAQTLFEGGADLFALDPPGRQAARDALAALLVALGAQRRCILVGFSQGGMLAMDYVLHGGSVTALALLSSSCIALDEWTPRVRCLAGLPVLVAHGALDVELSILAGERLRDLAAAGGAAVTWVPFDGGHEIPLPVWRALRRFLFACVR